jgi:hypothetical protein
LEAGGFVPCADFAFAQTDDRETLRKPHARAVPPISADRAAGDEFCVLVFDDFVDVGVALQDGDKIVPVERFQYLRCVCDREGAVFRGTDRIGGESGEGCYERNVNDTDYRRACCCVLQITGEPGHLFFVDTSFPETVVGGLDGIEDDEVIALMIEGVVGFADAVFVHFLAIGGIAGGHAAFFDDTEGVVIADGVANGHLQRLLGFFVKVKDGVGAIGPHGSSIVDVIAAHDGEFCFECGDFFETQVAAVRRVKFRFDVRVGEENKVERARRFSVRNQIERSRAAERRCGTCQRRRFQELSAIENHEHPIERIFATAEILPL